MYREHLLSINHVQKLLYHQVDTGASGQHSLHAPPFFMAQADKKYKAEFPQPIPVDAMLTVLTPHYGEKVGRGELSSVLIY